LIQEQFPESYLSNFTCPIPRTEVHFERKAEKKHTSHKEREGMKKRDIYIKYPDKAKADALIDRLYKAGLWHHDPDFKNDTEERHPFLCRFWGHRKMTFKN